MSINRSDDRMPPSGAVARRGTAADTRAFAGRVEAVILDDSGYETLPTPRGPPSGPALHCDRPAGGVPSPRSRRRDGSAPGPRAAEGTLAMSDSSSSGKFARDASKRPRRDAAAPDEWPATRAEPASQDEIDEWQATRIQARQPNGIDEWRVPQPPAGGTPQRIAASRRPPRRRRRVARRLGGDARADRARDPDPRGRERLPRRPRRTRSAARSAATSASCSSRAPRPRRCSSSSSTCSPEFIAVHDIAHLVVAQAAGRHRRGQRPRGAEARDPPPGLRHGARDARVRRAADRRQPAAAPLHDRGRRRHARRATRWRATLLAYSRLGVDHGRRAAGRTRSRRR